MYSREQIRQITDKVLNMAKADGVEVEFTGGERSTTRYANSSITANMVQFDQQLTVTVYHGQKVGSGTTRELDDEGLQEAVQQAHDDARRARENPQVLLPVKGPQEYLPIEAVLPSALQFGPAERAEMVRRSIEICEKKGVLGSGYLPKVHQATAFANSEGVFGYYEYAEASFILTCRTPDGGGSGWAGTTGVKDVGGIDPVQITETAADKALRSQKPRALEPGRYTVILEPRPAARFLSLMASLFSARIAESGLTRSYFAAEGGRSKLGEKVFSDGVTIRSDVGNAVLRQTPIGPDGLASRPITWVENGVLKNLFSDRQWAARQKRDPTPTAVNQSLVLEGTDMPLDEMIRTTRRGLLVTFLWYIRMVDQETLLNTGMTRDGLFLIENGEIVGPVQNFRWNMSPIVGFNNISAIGRAVPMHTGESYDGPGTALVPPIRVEDFFMTSVSPAV